MLDIEYILTRTLQYNPRRCQFPEFRWLFTAQPWAKVKTVVTDDDRKIVRKAQFDVRTIINAAVIKLAPISAIVS